jgi:alpha-D-ribose 1-methylphosphonate 5-triphosphate synthase subunit PhnL
MELWDSFPATFSGGEQQRINIARAVISGPRFLLLDEPTASLDAKTKDAVIDMILDLRQSGCSIALISHDAHTMQRLASRRLHLAEGRIEEAVHA